MIPKSGGRVSEKIMLQNQYVGASTGSRIAVCG